MSYILDALRRADAERERGAVPTLHAQSEQAVAAADADTDTPRATPAWLWVLLGLLLVAVLALAWKLLIAEPRPESATLVRADAAAPPPAPPSGMASSPPPPPPALPAQFPTQVLSEITPAPPPQRSPAPPKESRPPPRTEARADTSPPPASDGTPGANAALPAAPAAIATPTAAPTPRAAAASGTNAAASANAEERIYAIAELPEDIRRSLPALPISGSTYSQNPASRMLIVNGQVFHEGDAITPELKLEQIRLKGAVLRFRNYRYTIGF